MILKSSLRPRYNVISMTRPKLNTFYRYDGSPDRGEIMNTLKDIFFLNTFLPLGIFKILAHDTLILLEMNNF